MYRRNSYWTIFHLSFLHPWLVDSFHRHPSDVINWTGIKVHRVFCLCLCCVPVWRLIMTVGFSPTLYCWSNVTSSGNPIKCREDVLSLQPMIPPKRFDIFPPDWGMLRRFRCVPIFLNTEFKSFGSVERPEALDSYISSKVVMYFRRVTCHPTLVSYDMTFS